MTATGNRTAAYRFGEFLLDVGNRQVWEGRRCIPLSPKYFDVLLLLVSNSGRLIEKRRIFEEIWKGVFVSDSALTQCIKDIRRHLGDDASNPRYIKTVPKHGYMFIGDVAEASEAETRPRGALSDAVESPALSDDRTATAPIRVRPYKFLDYYTEDDRHLFFGRWPEVDHICSKILAHRSLVLHGRSGVGKSSILRAGLMARLKAGGHQVFVVRAFTDPLHQMAAVLGGEAGADFPLREMIARAAGASSGEQVIFLFDQFEEFFSLLDEGSRHRFADVIGDLVVDESLPLRLVFALREDLLAEMSFLKPALPDIFHNEYRLRRFNRHQAAEAIAEPARAVGCRYEPLLVDRLLDDLSDWGEIDPPQLQIVCDRLYDSMGPDGSLSIADYERLGTASRILAGYLERVLRRFNARDLRTARKLLASMISADGQRLVMRARELTPEVGLRQQEGDLDESAIAEELVAARIVRRRSQDGEAWVELAHDFLTPEVSRWLTAEDLALKRARAVIERALENYRAHGLMIGADALDLLLPFGEKLNLTSEEYDLLIRSILGRGRMVPEWLVRTAPSAAELLADATRNPDQEVRLSAVESCGPVRTPEMKRILADLSLRDESVQVRKAASIALSDWFGSEAAEIVSEAARSRGLGLVRRSVTLAILRDHHNRRVRLSRLPLPVAVLVVCGLAWVRLRRDGGQILRQSAGGTIGGAVSGFVGGLLLGLGLAMARQTPQVEALSIILVLVSLGTAIGGFGGLGVSLGIVAASSVAYRHSRWWSVIGAAAGGAAVGGSSKLLGVDFLKALFGHNPTGLAGALEGAALGAGVSLGAVLVSRLMSPSRRWQRVMGGAVGAMCAGILLTVVGGNMFSGSLEIVVRSFSDSQIRMDPLASFFGEVRFGQTTQVVMGAIEALLFGVGMMGGLEFARRTSKLG